MHHLRDRRAMDAGRRRQQNRPDQASRAASVSLSSMQRVTAATAARCGTRAGLISDVQQEAAIQQIAEISAP
jgi:hypothetical protein